MAGVGVGLMIKVFKAEENVVGMSNGDFIVEKQNIHRRRTNKNDYYTGMPIIEWSDGDITRCPKLLK